MQRAMEGGASVTEAADEALAGGSGTPKTTSSNRVPTPHGRQPGTMTMMIAGATRQI